MIVLFRLNAELRNIRKHTNLDLLLLIFTTSLFLCTTCTMTETFHVTSPLEWRASHSLKHKVDCVNEGNGFDRRPPGATFCCVGSDYITQVRRQVFNAFSLPGADVIMVNVDLRMPLSPADSIKIPIIRHQPSSVGLLCCLANCAIGETG